MTSEKNLIKKAKRGSRAAFGKLIEQIQDQILYLVYDHLGNYEEAQDVAQDIFVNAFEKIKNFDEKANFKTWIYKISINKCIDHLRKRKVMQNAHTKIESERLNFNIRPSENDLWDDEFLKALNTLSENQNSALILKYFQNKTTKEISEIMECDINTVRIHLHRGIQKLKNQLKKSGI